MTTRNKLFSFSKFVLPTSSMYEAAPKVYQATEIGLGVTAALATTTALVVCGLGGGIGALPGAAIYALTNPTILTGALIGGTLYSGGVSVARITEATINAANKEGIDGAFEAFKTQSSEFIESVKNSAEGIKDIAEITLNVMEKYVITPACSMINSAEKYLLENGEKLVINSANMQDPFSECSFDFTDGLDIKVDANVEVSGEQPVVDNYAFDAFSQF